MKKNNLLLLFSFFLLVNQHSFAQYDTEDETTEAIEEEDLNELSFKDRLYFGGNLGLSFGTFTQVNISPIVGYRVTNDFSAGVGVKYDYLGFTGSPSYSLSTYGGSAFARYSIIENLFAYTEFEMLNIEFYGLPEREWVPIGLIGAGYNFRPIQIMLLYDLIGDKRNPYLSPLGNQSQLYVRFGAVFGL